MNDSDYEVFHVWKRSIPKNGRALISYETEYNVIVVGDPPDEETEDGWKHNCDVMGCSSVEHVLYVFPKTSSL